MAIYYADSITRVYAPTVTNSTSRYKTKIRLVNNKAETVVRFIRKRDLNFSDSSSAVHTVNSVEAYRPDIIANEYFGNEKYSWVILSANNLKTPYELKQGLKIIIPSLLTLQGNKGKLVTR